MIKQVEPPMDFAAALAYLQGKGHPITHYSFRKELRHFPERFGAVRRNPLRKRGRGGKFYFYKTWLDKYKSTGSIILVPKTPTCD